MASIIKRKKNYSVVYNYVDENGETKQKWETWRTHKEALFYAGGKAVIRPLEDFQMALPDEREANYRLLWKRFYDTIAIKERENPRLRQTHMPKRYWNTMTEFQGEDYFKARSSPADAAIPAVPTARSAPEIPQGAAPSAAASAP